MIRPRHILSTLVVEISSRLGRNDGGQSGKRSEKKEVDLVEAVQRYLSDGSYPTLSSLNLKRAILNKAKKFKLRRGELYYMNVKRGRGSGKVSMCQGLCSIS